jgi:hypothetical protein
VIAVLLLHDWGILVEACLLGWRCFTDGLVLLAQ